MCNIAVDRQAKGRQTRGWRTAVKLQVVRRQFNMQITWNYEDTDFSWPPSFEKKVDIFYHRLPLGWQLHIADLIANGGLPLGDVRSVEPLRHSGFAVLHICLSYFETIGQYEQQNPQTKTSTGYFKAGVRSVLPRLHASHGNAVGELLARL